MRVLLPNDKILQFVRLQKSFLLMCRFITGS